ncbi:hypothetical protein H8959_012804 [Pygathrix nigripes]
MPSATCSSKRILSPVPAQVLATPSATCSSNRILSLVPVQVLATLLASWSSCLWDGAPTRLCLLPRNPPRVPPPVDWSPPSRKKPVLSAHNSMMFGHPSPVRIPRLRRRFNLRLPSLNEQVIPARLPKTEVRAEEPKEATEVKDQVETQEDNKRGPCSNGEAASTSRPLETQGNLTSSGCCPRPLEGNAYLKSSTEKNQNDKAQVHAVSFYPKGHGVSSSHSPAGGILPFGKPDPAPTVFPAPVPTVFPAPVPTVFPAPVPTVFPAPVPTVFPAPAPTVFPAPVPTVFPAPVPTVFPAPVPTGSQFQQCSLPQFQQCSLPQFQQCSLPQFQQCSLPQFRQCSLPQFRQCSLPQFRAAPCGQRRRP